MGRKASCRDPSFPCMAGVGEWGLHLSTVDMLSRSFLLDVGKILVVPGLNVPCDVDAHHTDTRLVKGYDYDG